jgi:hypothetical protein
MITLQEDSSTNLLAVGESDFQRDNQLHQRQRFLEHYQ